jgi:endonuclease/exonuclease/phosphatase (EEP) superfamily protein YafD
MFIGHFAVGFAAKKFAPRSSEAVLLAAPLLADILWPFFLLLGWEQVRIDPGNTRFTPLDFVFYRGLTAC